jgi:cystathionine beta-lyase/cystathionine gamma-synthase
LAGRRAPPVEGQTGLVYSRFNHPNLEIVEDRLAIHEKAASGLVFASGMAAIVTLMLAYLRPGETVLHSKPVVKSELLRHWFACRSVSSILTTLSPTLAKPSRDLRSWRWSLAPPRLEAGYEKTQSQAQLMESGCIECIHKMADPAWDNDRFKLLYGPR